MSRLTRFLNNKRTQSGELYTHTSLGDPCRGSFYIDDDDMKDFMEIYIEAYKSGEALHLTEAVQTVNPVMIDIDFRQDTSERLYTRDDINVILDGLGRCIKRYVSVKVCNAVVLEKPSPRATKNGRGYKDGLHIVYPDIVTTPAVQHAIRAEFLAHFAACTLGVIQGYTNTIEEMYDSAVIESNGWFLLGSKKPDEEHAWAITGHTYDADELAADVCWVEKLSRIYNVRPPARLTLEGKRVSKVTKQVNAPVIAQVHVSPGGEKTELAKRLVAILSARRADNYDEWMAVGWALHNIDASNLLGTWIEFSKRSIKFMAGECERLWVGMRSEGLGIGTLCMWAKQDSPDEYRVMKMSKGVDEKMDGLLEGCVLYEDNGLADVVEYLFKDTLRICGRDHYYFDATKTAWECNTNVEMYKTVSTRVSEALGEHMRTIKKRLGDMEEESPESSAAKTLLAGLQKCVTYINRTSGVSNVMKMASRCFKSATFFNELDCHANLLGVKNGVVDLRTGELRDRRPEDMIYNIVDVEYDPDACTDLIDGVVKSAMADDEEMSRYIQKVLGYCLTGENSEELFFVMTGSGRNCKGILMQVMRDLMGKMYVDVHNGLIVERSVGNMDAERAKLGGARIAVFNELRSGERLKEDSIKQLTGGDGIPAAAKYKDPVTIKPTFKCVLTTNCMPEIGYIDTAITERLVCINFPVTFTDLNGESASKFRRQRDNELKRKLKEDMGGVFAWLVAGAVKWYRSKDLKTNAPSKVKEFNREYIADQDKMQRFIDENCDTSDVTARIATTELLEAVNIWMRNNNEKMYTDKTLASEMRNKKFEKKSLAINGTRRNVFLGVRLAKRVVPNGSFQFAQDDVDPIDT